MTKHNLDSLNPKTCYSSLLILGFCCNGSPFLELARSMVNICGSNVFEAMRLARQRSQWNGAALGIRAFQTLRRRLIDVLAWFTNGFSRCWCKLESKCSRSHPHLVEKLRRAQKISRLVCPLISKHTKHQPTKVVAPGLAKLGYN